MQRRIISSLIFVLVVLPIHALAQGNLAINWTHSWGGTGTESGNAVATDSAGDVYVAGSTTSFGAGGQDVLLMKYDPAGNLLWARTWGGPNSEAAYGVLVDENGYVYLVGGTDSFGAGWYDVLILKFDSSGNLVWARTWGGGSYDVGHDLSFDSNGNLLIAAETYSFGTSAVLLRVSVDGEILSATTWKGPATYDAAYSITVDPGGNTILAGISWDYSVSPEHNTILVLKYDGQRNLVWNRNWAGPGGDEAWGTKIVRTDSLGNIYIVGRTTAVRGSSNFDVLLLELDPNGNLLWARKWGGAGFDTANTFWLDANSTLTVAGSTESFFGGQQSALTQQYDGSGDLLASKVLSSSAASGWNGLTANGSGTLIATGLGPNNNGTWQDTGIASVVAPGSLSTPTAAVANSVGSIGEPVGTISSPSGVLDSGGGGSNVLTDAFSVGGFTVIPQPPPPPTGSGPARSPTSQQASIAEPVSTGSGNYNYGHADFTIPARGLPVIFQRTYNSIDNFQGPLGANWNHGYNVMLSQTASGVATIRWGDGHSETYTFTGGVYVPQAGVYSSLVSNSNGTFTLTQKNQTQYVFSTAGKLTSIQDKNGNTVNLMYDGSGNLRMITGGGGRTLTLAYDSSGRILSVTDPIGHVESYSYDTANDLVSATNPLGGVTKYTYDGSHHVALIMLPNGNNLLQNSYDSQGRTISQNNGRGFTWQFAYNTPASGQTTITDARSATTIHTYDSLMRIVSIKDALGHATSYTYDSNNNRTSATNQNGNGTNISYDGNGNVTGITDPLSNSTALSYDATNNLLTVTNPKGKTTTFSYDLHNNLTGFQDAVSDKTALWYDSFGELTMRTDAAGHTTQFQYSSTGDLTGITDALGNVTTLAYDGDGRPVSVTDPNLHMATSAYDVLERLTKVSDPLGNQTKFVYDAIGDLASATDSNGHATTYAYDAVGNLASVTDALGHVTKYTYDADNNRIGFTNAKGNSVSYQFDSLNRLTRSVDPLGFATAYSYDAVGNVATVIDAKGQTNKFAYDALNHLLSIAYADKKNVAYTYDADGNRSNMIDWTGTTSYSYDANDRLTSVVFPGNKTVAYNYDANGRRATLTYPGGKSVSFDYDADERLATVSDWLSRVTAYSYDPEGNLTKVQYPNSAQMGFTYDPANRLTSVINTSVGVPPLAFNYALDPVGNRIKVTEAGIPTVYGYDALNQLTSAQTWPLQNSWTYDAVGNRLSEVSPFGTTKYSYDASDRLLTAGTRTFTYDADGNESSVADTFAHIKHTYSFNAADRLVSVDGGQTSSFAYDGDGNRISQSTGGLTQNYVNDIAAGLPVVLQDAIGAGPTSSYVYGLNLIEAFQPLSNDFYHYDGLGSVILLTDIKGRPETAYLYDAWGNSILPTLPTNPFRYAGQALDSATGLYYMRARYYDPSAGRFTEHDPFVGLFERPESLNRFEYVRNSPTRLTDPSGLCDILTCGKISSSQSLPVSQLAGPFTLLYEFPNLAPGPAFNQQVVNTLQSALLGPELNLAKETGQGFFIALKPNTTLEQDLQQVGSIAEAAVGTIGQTWGTLLDVVNLAVVPEVAK